MTSACYICGQVELELPASQLLGLFNRIMHKFHKLFSSLEESQEAAVMEPLPHTTESAALMKPVKESLEEELVCVCVCMAVRFMSFVLCYLESRSKKV